MKGRLYSLEVQLCGWCVLFAGRVGGAGDAGGDTPRATLEAVEGRLCSLEVQVVAEVMCAPCTKSSGIHDVLAELGIGIDNHSPLHVPIIK